MILIKCGEILSVFKDLWSYTDAPTALSAAAHTRPKAGASTILVRTSIGPGSHVTVSRTCCGTLVSDNSSL